MSNSRYLTSILCEHQAKYVLLTRCFAHFGETRMERRTMTAKTHRESAEIFMFPAGGRRAAASAPFKSAKIVEELAAQRLPKVVFGSGWYHDAAIEAEDSHKR